MHFSLLWQLRSGVDSQGAEWCDPVGQLRCDKDV